MSDPVRVVAIVQAEPGCRECTAHSARRRPPD